MFHWSLKQHLSNWSILSAILQRNITVLNRSLNLLSDILPVICRSKFEFKTFWLFLWLCQVMLEVFNHQMEYFFWVLFSIVYKLSLPFITYTTLYSGQMYSLVSISGNFKYWIVANQNLQQFSLKINVPFLEIYTKKCYQYVFLWQANLKKLGLYFLFNKNSVAGRENFFGFVERINLWAWPRKTADYNQKSNFST
jgi:hypothetical protein